MGSLERRAKFGTIQSVAPDAGYRAHVLWSGAATAPDPERPLVAPSSSQFAKLLDLSVAVPAPVHRVPLLAGIGYTTMGLPVTLLSCRMRLTMSSGAVQLTPIPMTCG